MNVATPTMNDSTPAHESVGEMDPRHLDELIRLEESYWWHVAKRELVTGILQNWFPAPGRLVEGGIGSARNLLEFQQLGYDVCGFDIMPEAVEHAHNRGLQDVQIHDLNQPWPLKPNSMRAVVLLDVLEHMADPVQVLKNAGEALEPGGGIVLTVPAYPCLYGDWDKSLGHYRRYTSRVLEAQAYKAGLNVSWITYWNAFTLPPALVMRGLDRLLGRKRSAEFPRVPAVVNELLLQFAKLERSWLHRFPMPCGLSLVGVLTK